MDYSIVIPLRNEAGNIGQLVNETMGCTVDDRPARIILVDDASSDDTVNVVHRLQEKYGSIVSLIRHETGLGQSTAIHNGVRAATTHWIITLDGDGQNDPADLPAFLALLRHANEDGLLLIGYRRERHDHWLRRVASRIANAVRCQLLGDGAPDTGCGLKAFQREFFLQLPYFDHMHRFVPALTRQFGGRVVSLPVHHRERRHGQSNYGIFDRLWVGIVDMFGVAWLGRRNRYANGHRDVV